MSSAEVVGFVMRHEPRESVADALVIRLFIYHIYRFWSVWPDGMK
jgi:hypothetical protein